MKTHKKNPSYLPAIIILTILVVGVGLYGSSLIDSARPLTINQISNSTGEVTLALSPSTVSPKVGEEVELTLSAKTGSLKLMVLTGELTYDASKISTPTITQGNFLGNSLENAKVENGKITFTYAATPDSGGAFGSGAIATIKFKPTSAGSSSISFGAGSTATAVKDGERIPGNSLLSASDTVISAGETAQNNNQVVNNNQQVDTSALQPSTTPQAKAPIKTSTPKPLPTIAPKTPSQATNTTPQSQTATPQFDSQYTQVSDEQNDYVDISSEDDAIPQDLEMPKINIFQKIVMGWKIIFQSIFNSN